MAKGRSDGPSMPKPGGKHRMPGGRMMSDKEMAKMMGGKVPSSKKK